MVYSRKQLLINQEWIEVTLFSKKLKAHETENELSQTQPEIDWFL